jgi:vacuolar-type H+-ATPase subunit E/Vma4
MALTDILQAITKNADKKIESAREQQQRLTRDKREESERTISKAKQDVALQRDRKKTELKAKAQTHAQSLKKNALLRKKRELLDQIFADVMHDLCALPEGDVQELLRACVDQLKNEGTLHPSSAYEDMLKKMLPNHIKMGSTTKAKGGFLFVSETQEQDFTFEHIVEHILRPKTELDASQSLFL